MQDIPYETFGGTGQVLHFSHANAYTPSCYRQLLEELSEQFHVVACHHRPLWDPHFQQFKSWHQSADDLIRFLDHHKHTQVVGIGHSYGAIVTAIAAVKRPELFSEVVLLDPVLLAGWKLLLFKATPTQFRYLFLPHIKSAKNRRYQWESPEAAFKYFRGKRVFHRFSDESINDLVQFGLERDEQGIRLRFPRDWEAKLYSTIPAGIWSFVTRVSHPMLGLAGVESDTLFGDAFERWQKAMPHASLERIREAGHLFPLEYPKDTAKRIFAFLESQCF